MFVHKFAGVIACRQLGVWNLRFWHTVLQWCRKRCKTTTFTLVHGNRIQSFYWSQNCWSWTTL